MSANKSGTPLAQCCEWLGWFPARKPDFYPINYIFYIFFLLCIYVYIYMLLYYIFKVQWFKKKPGFWHKCYYGIVILWNVGVSDEKNLAHFWHTYFSNSVCSPVIPSSSPQFPASQVLICRLAI